MISSGDGIIDEGHESMSDGQSNERYRIRFQRPQLKRSRYPITKSSISRKESTREGKGIYQSF